MAPPHAFEPDIPDAARRVWEELTGVAIPARQRAVAARDAAQAMVDKESANCRRLVVEGFRLGIRRQAFVGMPFSEAWVTRIQREAGLTRKQRAEAQEETGSSA